MTDLLAAAEAVHKRTGLLVTLVRSRQPEPFSFGHPDLPGVHAACEAGAEEDVIVIEDGRRFDATGEECIA